ncbi:MAG: SUF system NifU family Fe-S cluster assembly protein [Dehalococcoidia bacterium]|nr:SUF system NifU family Fe-S cluster assembly protein [Dehalococcoidia bacterium]
MTQGGTWPEIAWEELDALYREAILDHARNPRNRAPLGSPTVQAHVLNPFCGDEVFLDLAFRDGRVTDVGAYGEGCAVSRASASLMSGLLRGKTVAETRALAECFQHVMRTGQPSDAERKLLGDAEALAGVTRFPVRVKCALLAWEALDEALNQYEKGRKS